MVLSRVLASRRFAADLVSKFDTDWDADTYGAKPTIELLTQKRIIGLGKSLNENILVYPQMESSEFFGLGGQTTLNTVRAEISANTNTNEERFELITSSIHKILVDNVNPAGVDLNYLWWKLNGFTNLSYKGRNYFSGKFDVIADVFDPHADL